MSQTTTPTTDTTTYLEALENGRRRVEYLEALGSTVRSCLEFMPQDAADMLYGADPFGRIPASGWTLRALRKGLDAIQGVSDAVDALTAAWKRRCADLAVEAHRAGAVVVSEDSVVEYEPGPRQFVRVIDRILVVARPGTIQSFGMEYATGRNRNGHAAEVYVDSVDEATRVAGFLGITEHEVREGTLGSAPWWYHRWDGVIDGVDVVLLVNTGIAPEREVTS